MSKKIPFLGSFYSKGNKYQRLCDLWGGIVGSTSLFFFTMNSVSSSYSFFKLFGFEIALLLFVITAVIGLSRHFVFSDMEEDS